MMMAAAVLISASPFISSCSDFSDCRIGELTGTWRMSYTERNGNCGDVADETVNFNSLGGGGDCAVYAESISADQCVFETDFECPFDGGRGTQRWVLHLRQIGEGRISGTGTAQVQHVSGVCRSTYDIERRRL